MAPARVANSGSLTINATALHNSNVTSYSRSEDMATESISTIASVTPGLSIQNKQSGTASITYLIESGTLPVEASDINNEVIIYTLPGEFTETYTATASSYTETVTPGDPGKIECQLELMLESTVAFASLS